MVIGIEVGPVEGEDGLLAVGQQRRHPGGGEGVEVELGVGQEAIDLLDGMLGNEPANAGQARANGGDGQGSGVEDAGSGIGQGENPLFMHKWELIMNEREHASER